MEKNDNNQSRVTTPLPSFEREEVGALSSGSEDEALIAEVFARRAQLADLDSMIIADVRRKARRAWLRRWARIAAFSFGLPLVLFVFFACAHYYIKEQGWTSVTILVILWPTLALLFTAGFALNTFSPDEV